MARRIISLELDGRFLRAVKTRRGWKKVVLETSYFDTLPGDSDDSEDWEEKRSAFQRWAKEGGKADSIVSGLSGTEAVSSLLRFPFRRLSKIEQVIKAGMEDEMPLPVDEMVVDFVQAGNPSRGEQEVLAVGAPKAALTRLLDRLDRLGIVPDRIEYTPLSVLKAVLTLMPSFGDSIFGAVHIGASCVSFSLSEGGKPIYIRTFRRGGRDEGADPEGGESAESPGPIDRGFLVREIRLTLRACSRLLKDERRIAHLVLTGEGADMSLSSALGAELGIHCRAIDWGKGAGFSARRSPSPEILGKICGALGGAVEKFKSFGKTFDLRKEEFARRLRWRDLRRPVLSAAAAVAIAFSLGMADLVLKVRREENRLDAVRTEVRAALRQVFPQGDRISNPSRRIFGMVQAQSRSLNALLGDSMGERSPLKVMSGISASVPRSIELRLNQLMIGERAVSIRGEALSFEAVDRVKSLLAEKGGFSSAEVKQARILTGRRGVEFFIQLSANEAGKGRER